MYLDMAKLAATTDSVSHTKSVSLVPAIDDSGIKEIDDSGIWTKEKLMIVGF